MELTAVLAVASVATPPASAIPTPLLAQTTRAALAMVEDGGAEAISDVVPSSVAALVKSNSSLASLATWKRAAALVLAASLATGGLLAHRISAKEPPPQAVRRPVHKD